MERFSIDTIEFNVDGSIKRDAQGQPIPTYTQAIIEGFVPVFTGCHYAGARVSRRADGCSSIQHPPPMFSPRRHGRRTGLCLRSHAQAVYAQLLPVTAAPFTDYKARVCVFFFARWRLVWLASGTHRCADAILKPRAAPSSAMSACSSNRPRRMPIAIKPCACHHTWFRTLISRINSSRSRVAR